MTREEVTRSFWAEFLEAKVEKDGQVPGYRKAWAGMSDWAREQADRYCHFAWAKIQRDGRDAEECIAAGVRALRDQIRLYRPPEITTQSKEYVLFRFGLIDRVFSEKLKPIDVARILESQADRFPEITLEECTTYRAMGDRWDPNSESPTWWERRQQDAALIDTRAEISIHRDVLRVIGNAPNDRWPKWDRVSREITGKPVDLYGIHQQQKMDVGPSGVDVPPPMV